MITKSPVLRQPARPDLPTMYDLPSEDPEEPGLADDFHSYQPHLLRETFQPSAYPRDQVYLATDLNLYFDPDHTLWHKRPDWFAVLGIPAPREQQDLRLSYVIWQEQVPPYVVVELLSPGTEKEDLGQTTRTPGQPPTKWEVYEQILQVPYYVVFSRYQGELRLFQLAGQRYRRLRLADDRYWFTKLGLGLGIWTGAYQGIRGKWLRWFGADGAWIPTLAESREQAEQRAEQERQRAEQLAARLRALGIEP